MLIPNSFYYNYDWIHSGNYDGTPLAKIILMFLMVVGGCSGSTSGGLKIIRVIIAFKALFKTSYKLIPVKPLSSLDQYIGAFVQNILLYILFIFTIQGMSVIVLSFLEPSLNLISLFSVAQSSLYNIGPGFDAIGPTQDFGFLNAQTKLFLSFLMILGRLEIYALVVLIVPNIWKRYSLSPSSPIASTGQPSRASMQSALSSSV